MPTQFKLHNVTKRFGDREVLSIGQLNIKRGKIYTILGPNGSGKSTLLRIMALLLVNDEGKLEVLGEIVGWEKAQILRLRRQMTMVTQTSFMLQGSVNYNVSYGLRVRNLKEEIIQSRVKKVLEIVGMAGYRDADARTLSGGERQKVALARAMAVNPRVLLLDEPTSNIDIASAIEIEKHIRLLNKEKGTTIIMVTHNLFQARRLSDEVIFMNEGHIIEQGTEQVLFEQPRDKRTAAFLRGETIF